VATIQVAFPLDPLMLGAGLLLLIGALAAAFAQRVRMPALLLFLALGMVLGDDGLGWFTLTDPGVAQTAGLLALLVILFEGGLTTRATDLRAAAIPGFTLATLGVVLTAGIVAGGVLLFTELSVTTALLLGAVVSSTDAAAVFTVVRKSPLPRRITSLLEVESGANDPMAVLLTVGVLEAWRADLQWQDFVTFGVLQLGGGAAVGAFSGMVGVFLLRRVRLGAATLYPVVALGIAGAAYGLAAWVGGSGFLAVYLCGLLVGLYVPRYRRAIRTFFQALSGVAEIGLFLLLGLLVFPSQLLAVGPVALVTTVVLVVAARPVAVHVGMAWHLVTKRWRPAELAVVSWAGLRGAVPIVLATLPFTAAYPDGPEIFNVVFFVVLISTAVQGSTIGVFASMLGLRRSSAVWAPIAEFLPVDDPEIDLMEVEVAEDMRIAGRRLADVPLPERARVLTVLRRGATIVADGDTELRADDRVVIIAATDPANDERITSWALGESGR
jgi:potassium/hydrogen antiporter